MTDGLKPIVAISGVTSGFRTGELDRAGVGWPAPSAAASNPLHGPVANHAKVDLVDQMRTERLGGTRVGHRLF